ncbi:hypothetical protein [Pelagicoccus sp. SDUM812003]|uniref:hypothetical protein n=1 Tax=Pelagicoccus sp. SDUM812003 TaxID=3041267 RepID=UPI00280D4348|nr:hypothetical protein [Pelagicoccus sp. SDUM812003]MDQ8203252.1 hypothetical protein [Pelagicoccus sp. SDUM812003]
MNPLLPEAIAKLIDWSLARTTRFHQLPSGLTYIKREDELSSGVTGSKLRKYASLLPYLDRNEIRTVGLIGGPNSNNLVGILQLLKEKGVEPLLFLREAADARKRGNALFLSMLAPPNSIRRIPRSEWQSVETVAQELLPKEASFLIPEGALCFEALPGAMSLASDLLRNEAEDDTFFERIFIDSGTGMSAIGLLLGLRLLDPRCRQREIVITLIAGEAENFLEQLRRFEQRFEGKFSLPLGERPKFVFLVPPTAAKYGATNASVLQACHRIAQTEGLLMDPIYSVKHYLAAEQFLHENDQSTPSLFIYNGGSLGICGFLDRLSDSLDGEQ